MLYQWDDLPAEVRRTVESELGALTMVEPVRPGENSDLAAVLHLADSRVVFLKGVCGVSPKMRWLRTEARVAPLVARWAPALVASIDVAGWLLVAVEHVAGRPARLEPGSGDLAVVAGVLDELAEDPVLELPALAERWAGTRSWAWLAQNAPEALPDWATPHLEGLDAWEELAPKAVVGDRLLHTDLHETQFLIEDARARVIDWARPAAGAPWVDTLLLTIRLLGAGHTPAEAERWAATTTAWATAGPGAVTAVAAYVAGLWTRRAVEAGTEAGRWRAGIAAQYAAWRLGTR